MTVIELCEDANEDAASLRIKGWPGGRRVGSTNQSPPESETRVCSYEL
jgi:hypothetical protein